MTDYDIVTYAAMLADRGRVEAYARALERCVAPGCTVLDLGTGTGIFAMLACRAGAARVYAVEPDDIIEVARDMARANGFADRITFVRALSTAIDLPERVDGIVADVRGVLPLHRDSLRSMIDARDRFLKAGGWIVPLRDTMTAAIATSPAIADVMFGTWDTTLGVDATMVSRRARFMGMRQRLSADQLLTAPRPWATIDYGTNAGPAVAGSADWTVARSGIGHGLAVWFDSDTAPDAGFSNSPLSHEQHIYGQVILPWPEPAPLEAGDRVTATIRADLVGADYLWTWKTAIEPTGTKDVRRFSQSTLEGTPIAADRLRRRAHMFVPTLGDEAEIDRLALSLLAGGRSLGDVAGALLADYPRRFGTYTEALTHVADLAERYAI